MGYYNFNGLYSSSFYLYEPSQKRRYHLENGILPGTRLHASKFGWLLFTKERVLTTLWAAVFFYCPFTGEIIQLPDLYTHNEESNSMAAFSTAPTSSDCVVFVFTSVGGLKSNHYASTCSPGDTKWQTVKINNGNYGYHYNQKKVAYAKGVFYCAFLLSFDNKMGVYNPALKEWKIYQLPSFFRTLDRNRYRFDLIESPDDGNLLLSYCRDGTAYRHCVFRFDPTQKKWYRIENFTLNLDVENWLVEIENLDSRILYCSSVTGISVAAEGEARELANTMHWCSHEGSRGGMGESCPQIYEWVDRPAGLCSRQMLSKVWIQPRHAHKFTTGLTRVPNLYSTVCARICKCIPLLLMVIVIAGTLTSPIWEILLSCGFNC